MANFGILEQIQLYVLLALMVLHVMAHILLLVEQIILHLLTPEFLVQTHAPLALELLLYITQQKKDVIVQLESLKLDQVVTPHALHVTQQ